jgi:orotate phosphoribosyltransferase
LITLHQQIHDAVVTMLPTSLLAAFSANLGEKISAKKLATSKFSATEMLRSGLLRHVADSYHATAATKIAAYSGILVDVSDTLTIFEFESLHRDSLKNAVVVHENKDISLLHAKYRTSHYFNSDALLAHPSSSFEIILDTFRSIISALKVDFIVCNFSHEGLAGTYPICVQISNTLKIPVCAMIPERTGAYSFIGNKPPLSGKYLVIHDVLTTGMSIIRMHERVESEGGNCSGALLIYDRREGGRELLQSHGINVLSLMSANSLRRYCDGLVRSEQSSLSDVANDFLGATKRLNVVPIFDGRVAENTVRIALGVGGCPPMEAFRSDGRFKSASEQSQLEYVKRVLKWAARNRCSLVIFPELTLPSVARPIIERATLKRRLVIIGGAEYDSAQRNVALISMRGQIWEQAKRVRSPYDFPSMVDGDTLYVFDKTPIGSFSVLICADQIDSDSINFLKNKIDFLIIVARNKSIKTFGSIAVGDSYRIYCCVIVANDKNCGDSVIASPKKGDEKLRWLRSPDDGNPIFLEFELDRFRDRMPEFHKQLNYEPKN